MRRLLCAAGAIGWMYLCFFLGHVIDWDPGVSWWGVPTFILAIGVASAVECILIWALVDWEKLP